VVRCRDLTGRSHHAGPVHQYRGERRPSAKVWTEETSGVPGIDRSCKPGPGAYTGAIGQTIPKERSQLALAKALGRLHNWLCESLLEVPMRVSEQRVVPSPPSEGINRLFKQVIESETFRAAPVMRALLVYLWQHQGESVSEYAIAIDALGRQSDFDPKVDANVSNQNGTEAPPSRADSVRRCLAPEGDLGLLPIPRCSR
jgi:hypothetical protein